MWVGRATPAPTGGCCGSIAPAVRRPTRRAPSPWSVTPCWWADRFTAGPTSRARPCRAATRSPTPSSRRSGPAAFCGRARSPPTAPAWSRRWPRRPAREWPRPSPSTARSTSATPAPSVAAGSSPGRPARGLLQAFGRARSDGRLPVPVARRRIVSVARGHRHRGYWRACRWRRRGGPEWIAVALLSSVAAMQRRLAGRHRARSSQYRRATSAIAGESDGFVVRALAIEPLRREDREVITAKRHRPNRAARSAVTDGSTSPVDWPSEPRPPGGLALCGPFAAFRLRGSIQRDGQSQSANINLSPPLPIRCLIATIKHRLAPVDDP